MPVESGNFVLLQVAHHSLNMARPIDDAAARSLLSQRGYEAQHDRGFMKTVDVIADLYDVQSNPGGFISLGVAENVCPSKL